MSRLHCILLFYGFFKTLNLFVLGFTFKTDLVCGMEKIKSVNSRF